MRLQNCHAPLRNFSPDFNDVFAQVIKLGHFYVVANQSIIKLFNLRILRHLVAKILIRKGEIRSIKLLRYSRCQSAAFFD